MPKIKMEVMQSISLLQAEPLLEPGHGQEPLEVLTGSWNLNVYCRDCTSQSLKLVPEPSVQKPQQLSYTKTRENPLVHFAR